MGGDCKKHIGPVSAFVSTHHAEFFFFSFVLPLLHPTAEPPNCVRWALLILSTVHFLID
jgi:hypothetical protein